VAKAKKAKHPDRIIMVTGYFVLNGADEAYHDSLEQISMAGLEGDWGLEQLDEMTLTEVDAVVTRQGIRRTDR
jgi:hypothetical protein